MEDRCFGCKLRRALRPSLVHGFCLMASLWDPAVKGVVRTPRSSGVFPVLKARLTASESTGPGKRACAIRLSILGFEARPWDTGAFSQKRPKEPPFMLAAKSPHKPARNGDWPAVEVQSAAASIWQLISAPRGFDQRHPRSVACRWQSDNRHYLRS